MRIEEAFAMAVEALEARRLAGDKDAGEALLLISELGTAEAKMALDSEAFDRCDATLVDYLDQCFQRGTANG